MKTVWIVNNRHRVHSTILLFIGKYEFLFPHNKHINLCHEYTNTSNHKSNGSNSIVLVLVSAIVPLF